MEDAAFRELRRSALPHPVRCHVVYMALAMRQCGPVVRALGLYAAAPGSNPVLTSGLDLFPVVPDSTPPRFVNSQLVPPYPPPPSPPVGVLNNVSVKFELLLSPC